MNKADTRLLAKFLESPDRPEGTLRFHELQGLLFAIASSPETILPSEWLPLIGNEVDLDFADQNEAQQILGLVMTLFNEVNTSVLERSNALPPGCAFARDILENFDDDSSISQWSRGFTSGHNWLAEVWEGFPLGELDEECGATVPARAGDSFVCGNSIVESPANSHRQHVDFQSPTRATKRSYVLWSSTML